MSNPDGDGIRYYWCVNCGRYGFFTTVRYRGVCCPHCKYDEPCKLEKEEFEEAAKERPWILKNENYEEYHNGKKR